MKIYRLFAVWCLLLITVIAGADTMDELEDRYSDCMVKGKYVEAMSYADKMLAMTEQDTLSFDRFMALAYSGQAYLAADRYKEAYNMISSAIKLWDSRQHDDTFVAGGMDLFPVLIVYNCLGVYSINYELDYEKGTTTFIKALDFAMTHNLDYGYSLISYNLLMSFYIRGDSSGLKYAQDIYQKGKEKEDSSLMYMGAYGEAMMYVLKQDYANAERFISEALASPVKTEDTWGNNIYAMVLSGMGKNEEARIYFEKALRGIDNQSSTIATHVCLSYGGFLYKMGEFADAVSVLHKGVEMSDDNDNKIFIYQLYESLSLSYKALGKYEEALDYYGKYHYLSDSVFNIRKERAINELTIKYKTYLYEAEMKEKDLALIKKNYSITLLLIMIAIVLVALILIYGMYRNKNRMYTKIVMLYQNLQRKTKAESELLLKSDKSRDIIACLENLMKNEQIYKDHTLSRDRVAELIGTNRTYLSKVVNDYYGKSINQLINSYRIDRAVELLSNTENDMPMKAIEADCGFNSSSNFFKLFKDYMGMSPAKFRKNIIDLSKSKSDNLTNMDNNNFEIN